MVMLGTIALTGYLYVDHSQGLLSPAGHRIDHRPRPRRRRTFPSRRWPSASRRCSTRSCEDPAVDSVGSAIGAGGGNYTLNDGRVFISLKPAEPARASADQVIARLRTNLAKIQGITLYMQAAQDITIGARLPRRSISTR